MKRENIGQKARFEIFKRDSFRCVYCGQSPPTVVLQVDHVVPVSGGGGNDEVNLVTSCFDCNSGKSDIPLEQLPVSHAETLEFEQEKMAQLRAVALFGLEKRKLNEALFKAASPLWIEQPVDEEVEVAIKKFLKVLPLDVVMDAIELTNARLRSKDEYQRMRYFCGICNYRVRGELPTRPSRGYR